MAKSPILATKIQVMSFIRKKDVVEAYDLVEKFGYTPEGARSRLFRLEKNGLVERITVDSKAYCLTVEAHRRLEYNDKQSRRE